MVEKDFEHLSFDFFVIFLSSIFLSALNCLSICWLTVSLAKPKRAASPNRMLSRRPI